MAVLRAAIFLLLQFYLTSSYVLREEVSGLLWPSEYHITGITLYFHSTIKEPFEVWYNANLNRSRIDYNGGASKIYIYGQTETVYKVFPISDDDLSSETICLSSNLTDTLHKVPNGANFKYTGETTILSDKVVDIWTSRMPDENYIEYIKEDTLYAYTNEKGYDIPVRHVTKKFGSHGELKFHIITEFDSIEELANEEDLTVEDDCQYVDQDFSTLGLYSHGSEDLDVTFDAYATHHGKQYHETEREMRRRIFEKNMRMVEEHNRKNLSWTMELNQFSDMTPQELRHLTGTLDPTLLSGKSTFQAMPFSHSEEQINKALEDLPENFDLRMKDAVTRVKNQGTCGSCWAFATVAALEGAFSLANGGRLMDFSEQSLVDCAWSNGNWGCNGGFLSDVWEFIVDHGIPTEEEYGEYTQHDNYCKLANMTKLYKIKGFGRVPPRSANAMKLALYHHGPVTVTIYASNNMKHYSSGVFYDPECENTKIINHAVTVVGYGVRDGEEYWLVKNTWGQNWGQAGYILMSAKNNNCLLLDDAYYPIV